VQVLSASSWRLPVTALTPELSTGLPGKPRWEDRGKRFSTETAYPGQPFPPQGGEAHCVLCLQPLEQEALDQMARFDLCRRTRRFRRGGQGRPPPQHVQRSRPSPCERGNSRRRSTKSPAPARKTVALNPP